MAKYFMAGTPQAGLERQMMTPPNHTPRGGGQMVLCRFRYRPEDVVCKNCVKYQKKKCTMPVCPWLEERAEAGTVTYASLAAEYYGNLSEDNLGGRAASLLAHRTGVFYHDEAHPARLRACAPLMIRHQQENDRLAAIYLLTATEHLSRTALPRLFDLWTIRPDNWETMRTLSQQEYVLYQAAKSLWQKRRCISHAELSDRELVDDAALTLILDAQLIEHYGKAMLSIGQKGGGK